MKKTIVRIQQAERPKENDTPGTEKLRSPMRSKERVEEGRLSCREIVSTVSELRRAQHISFKLLIVTENMKKHRLMKQCGSSCSLVVAALDLGQVF